MRKAEKMYLPLLAGSFRRQRKESAKTFRYSKKEGGGTTRECVRDHLYFGKKELSFPIKNRGRIFSPFFNPLFRRHPPLHFLLRTPFLLGRNKISLFHHGSLLFLLGFPKASSVRFTSRFVSRRKCFRVSARFLSSSSSKERFPFSTDKRRQLSPFTGPPGAGGWLCPEKGQKPEKGTPISKRKTIFFGKVAWKKGRINLFLLTKWGTHMSVLNSGAPAHRGKRKLPDEGEGGGKGGEEKIGVVGE